jgi:energy-coupling factor transporter ATP-binding protein EcfA2
MIMRLKLKGFTLFRSAQLDFARGINVFVGSNGTGKSHLLKLAYTCVRWSQEMALRTAKHGQARLDRATMQKELGGKLVRVFRPEQLGRLTSRGRGRGRAEVQVAFAQRPKAGFKFSFATNSSTDVSFDAPPEEFFDGGAVFLPTKEMLSMFPGFAALYDNVSIEIDETYADLCRALDRPLLRGPRFKEIDTLLTPLESLLGGAIRNENGRFYLVQEGSGKFEISLVAEGFRKLGTVAYLLANGSLTSQSVLFWDEPETNLNPAYMRRVAEMLVRVAGNGTQVFVATHSLFMLRELSLLAGGIDSRFFALSEKTADLAAEWDKRSTVIQQGSSAEEIEPITALDAEIEQSDRYLNTTP